MILLPFSTLTRSLVIAILTRLSIASCRHVSVEPLISVKLDGNNITNKNLHQFLESHEKLLLFGHDQNAHPRTAYDLVNVQINNYHKARSRRSVDSADADTISLQINDGKESSNITFHKANKLIDDNFVFISRKANHTHFVDGANSLKEIYSNCFYRNQNSVIDICDGTVRGFLSHNSKKLILHPLPHRFGPTTHIIYDSLSESPSISPFTAQFPEQSEGFEPKKRAFEPISGNETHVRVRRRIGSSQYNKIPQNLFVETAIFVDRDLFRHMAQNYPTNTEANLIRFVLSMINGVQLLYHHPSLGYRVNFLLKRLEILHTDPKELRRSSNIDVFLNSFCMWQRKFNPVADDNSVHFDHAVILTGLDLYVVGKNGKVSSQVVGLAPVAGMCTSTSSCTINEGKHFESVFVVAHEIGHNLGMRHDTSENNCDPSLYIMSPTLGSGKVTWSKCSQNYLKSFLETSQARCLFDRGQSDSKLDHSADGMMPGERFDADQQCMLKYGKDSLRSLIQPTKEICRDLHCQRDRYTWTSHPALEGTNCGDAKWCRSGKCILKTETIDSLPSYTRPKSSVSEKNFLEISKTSNALKQEYTFSRSSVWSEWSKPSECESGCLFGENGRLRDGSAGLKTFSRSCQNNGWMPKKCNGRDKRYETCAPSQCFNVPRMTIKEFTDQICERARKFDGSIMGEGIQQISKNPEDSCKIFCKSKTGKPTAKNWIFPDGTKCRNLDSDIDDTFYCVNGRCEEFACSNSSANYFQIGRVYCARGAETSENNTVNTLDLNRSLKSLKPMASRLVQSNWKNDVATPSQVDSKKAAPEPNRGNQSAIIHSHSRRLAANEWIVKSGCHFTCTEQAKGLQIIESSTNRSMNIQLCDVEKIACDRMETLQEFATSICKKYQAKVRGLSGRGVQIASSISDPDRACKVACQDEHLPHRFYIVSGEQGYFPFGTKCSRSNDNRYCVNGKCLQFGDDNIPLMRSYINLAHFRSKRSVFHASLNRNKLLR